MRRGRRSAGVPYEDAIELFEAGKNAQAAALLGAGKGGIALGAVEGRDDSRHVIGFRFASDRAPAQEPQAKRIVERASMRRLSMIDQPLRFSSA